MMKESWAETELQALLDSDVTRMERLTKGIQQWERFRWIIVLFYVGIILILIPMNYKLFELTRDSLVMLNRIPGGAATIIGIGIGQGIGLGLLYHHCFSEIIKFIRLDDLHDQKRNLIYYHACRKLNEERLHIIAKPQAETLSEQTC